MHREFNHESKGIGSKVKKLIPSCCTNFSRSTKMHDKLDNINVKLKDLLEEKTALGLQVEEEPRSKNKNKTLQTSIVNASSIVGRHFEKEALVQKLLGGESCHQNFSIVPIVGMGGVGKTTLAKLLYNDEQVKDHFEHKAWVCVSDEFDIFAISKGIFQSVTGEYKKFANLNLLQVDLEKHLTGKRFLLVLDDVWSESWEDWQTLVGPFHLCAPGSRIIMTTRKDQLLKKLGCDDLTKLRSLSHEDSLSLFALHALGVNTFDSHLSLKPCGEGIVKKCDGLPLALISLGRSLRTKQDEDSWREVLESEIWRSKNDIVVPALRLSYQDLPAPLKQVFAYCSLFPKDFIFEKEEIVLLWMAEGFLHSSTSDHPTHESLGHEYFDELLSRSFFQHAPNIESLFVMHDLMNDLATSIGGEFFVRLDNQTENNSREDMLEKYRHVSFVREEFVTYKKFEKFKRARCLRTFLATSVMDEMEEESRRYFFFSNKILVDLLLELPLLRVLCLSDFEISEVPESIGTLRHLRYLNLSRTRITCLPENVCNLYNLQTLIIFGCNKLTKLPNNFLKLKNLRHLDIKDTPLLEKMPLGIGDLKNLQTLSKIIIGDEIGFELANLKEFKNLCGKISIVDLDKVKNAIHAREANFSQKRFSELDLVWSDGSRNEMLEKEVLNELKPRNDKLIQLKIRSYGGLEFPNWVGHPSFPGLKHVTIHDCKRCTSLPPFGQLPALKELFIEGLDGVKVVGMELLGICDKFSSLETLSFQRMSGWTQWSTNGRGVFPRLHELLIKDCPYLVEVTLEALPSLNVLEIDSCDINVLRRLVQVASAVIDLKIESISRLNDAMWRGVIEYFGAIEELKIYVCNEIRYLWESEADASKFFVNLRKLEVYGCDNLVRLGEKEDEDNCRTKLLTSLRMLEVSFCKSMERCRCPGSIERLEVAGCHSITVFSLPTEGQKLKSLVIRDCKNLLETEWGGQKMNNRMLEYVDLRNWSNLKSIIELKYLVHLTRLKIFDCKSLESFPDNDLSNLTSLKELRIINCPSMDASFGFWPPKLQSLRIGKLKKSISDWGPQNFPTSLVELELYGDDGVSSGTQVSHLLPSSLTSLTIMKFEKLESISMGIQHLTSLQHLEFMSCPNMMDLPEVLLSSLLSLRIYACPNLEKRCSESKRGGYWHLISHIPYIYI